MCPWGSPRYLKQELPQQGSTITRDTFNLALKAPKTGFFCKTFQHRRAISSGSSVRELRGQLWQQLTILLWTYSFFLAWYNFLSLFPGLVKCLSNILNKINILVSPFVIVCVQCSFSLPVVLYSVHLHLIISLLPIGNRGLAIEGWQ